MSTTGLIFVFFAGAIIGWVAAMVYTAVKAIRHNAIVFDELNRRRAAKLEREGA